MVARRSASDSITSAKPGGNGDPEVRTSVVLMDGLPVRSRLASLRPVPGKLSRKLQGERGARRLGRFCEDPSPMRRGDLIDDEQTQTQTGLGSGGFAADP